LPNVCKDLWQECSKYTKDALEHCCRKPKQTAKIFRAEYIIVFSSMGALLDFRLLFEVLFGGHEGVGEFVHVAV
jgi:hypothetical protein